MQLDLKCSRSIMAKKKLILDWDYEFLLFAISCHARDYKLCWHLNKALSVQLSKEEDFEIKFAGSTAVSLHSFYSYFDELNRLKYIIIANRSESGFLVEEHKEADYFLVLDGFHETVDKAELLKKLKSSEVILTAFEIDPNNLKSKQNLAFV